MSCLMKRMFISSKDQLRIYRETVLSRVRSHTCHQSATNVFKVFLRALDYFQGILFLTTNRVGQFDEAFLSRIHLSLGYKPLNDAARAQIWDNLFQKLRDDHRKQIGPKIDFDLNAKRYAKCKDVMDLKWNGREIRNGRCFLENPSCNALTYNL